MMTVVKTKSVTMLLSSILSLLFSQEPSVFFRHMLSRKIIRAQYENYKVMLYSGFTSNLCLGINTEQKNQNMNRCSVYLKSLSKTCDYTCADNRHHHGEGNEWGREGGDAALIFSCF